MTISGIISAIIIGLIIGALGRLVVPGRQSIPIWLTIIIGIVAAFVGTLLAAVSPGFWLLLLGRIVQASECDSSKSTARPHQVRPMRREIAARPRTMSPAGPR